MPYTLELLLAAEACPVPALHEFEEEKEDDHAYPDETEHGEKVIVARKYKKIKERVQHDGEDKSEHLGQSFYPRQFAEAVCHKNAYRPRRDDVKQGRADEAQVPGDEASHDVAAAQGSQEEQSVFGGGEPESGRNEIHHAVYRLIVVAFSQRRCPCGRKLPNFFNARPQDNRNEAL